MMTPAWAFLLRNSRKLPLPSRPLSDPVVKRTTDGGGSGCGAGFFSILEGAASVKGLKLKAPGPRAEMSESDR